MTQLSPSALAYSMAYETNGISSDHRKFSKEMWDEGGVMVDLTDKRLERIVRLRLIIPSQEEQMTGLYWADVSYCWGVLKDGSKVRVQLRHQIDLRKGVKSGIVQMCQRAGVYGKKLGLLDDNILSTIR